MVRDDFKKLSQMRRREARILLAAKQYAGAYYLSGLAVECAIKACIAKHTVRHEFPELKRVQKSHVHDFDSLIIVAQLKTELDQECSTNSAFDLNWATAKDWDVNCRYLQPIDSKASRDMYDAIATRNTGVLQWLHKHW